MGLAVVSQVWSSHEGFRLFSSSIGVPCRSPRKTKILRDGKEYVYQSEIRVGTGTMDYAPHLVGGVYRMRTRVQVSNSEQTLNVEITDIKKSEYMGPVDPRNQNTNALTFAPAEQASTKFQVNLNSDGTFK